MGTGTTKPKTPTKPATAKSREMRPSTLHNHIEHYCKNNELGQDDTIKMLLDSIEDDIISEAKSRG